MPNIRTNILKLLSSTGTEFISGEEMSRQLGISRTAVWKQISHLRQSGYNIQAVTSKGYRLLVSADMLTPELINGELSTSIIGKELLCRSEVVSTNLDAFKLAEDGAPEGFVVCADSQSGGKGRLGRRWESPSKTNLYCSIILRPNIPPYNAPQLTFLSAVAVAEAIEKETNAIPEIKWPNDVLIQGHKIAGLLNEMSAETDRVNFVILGIGVNLNMSIDQFPNDLRTPATSIFIETGQKISRSSFAAVLLNRLDLLYLEFLQYGFEPVRKKWEARCNAYGRRVEITDGGEGKICGFFTGIDENGAMLVELENGKIERIYSGDVRVL